MKRKLTIFMFGLLLAVGWTNVASAQAYILKADDMADWTYKWLPENATDSVEEHFVEINPKTHKYAAKEVTDPYQIYDLLRTVYMDKRFPGHFYSAYTSTGERENPTYYGGIDGGWNIPYGQVGSGTTQTTYPDIVISTGADYTSEISHAYIYSIQIIADGNTISSWDYSTNQQYFGDGWTLNGTWSITASGYLYTSSSSNTLVFDGSLLTGYSSVQVKVQAYHYNYSYDSGYAYVYVNSQYAQLTSSLGTYTATLTGSTVATGETTPTDVLIELRNASTYISNITITDGNTTLYSWSGSTNGNNLNGAIANKTLTRYSSYSTSNYCFNSTDGGTIRVPASRFTGHNSINVSITGYGYFMIFGRETNSSNQYTWTSINGTQSYTVSFPRVVATDTYKPYNEGYTALMLSIKNNGKIYQEPSAYLGACEFTTKDEVIGYIRDNIKSVKLLTDGIRIGAGEDIGTVFNCDGTYNKFFFLSKGRARKKSSGVLTTIGNRWPSYACEEVPFKFMFEQFSPTGGEDGDQITDFYIEMMDGAVYPIEHDCASVIQNGHQFSMSGNTGTQNYAMSGMNFFIPDYRLKYWPSTKSGHKVDGRDYNPYMCADDNGKLDSAFMAATYFAVNYAAYNAQHAPKVGLYTITLDAEAKPCEGYVNPGNTNYTVTLDWTSSLNEMSGGDVPQKYVIYEVTYDEEGVEHLDSITTVVNTTTYNFGGKKWPQHDYSETHTYIIKGYPTDSDHPSFIAWSNQDAIVIPGLKDFLALKLDHYESDFDIPNMQNWYRNFLNVSNENEANGLTTDSIYKGYNVFNLMRYEDNDSTVAKQVARIVFENQTNGTVKYTITYVDELGNPTQQIEPYDINKPAVYNEAHTQIIKPAVNITDAYQRSKLGIQDVGYLTVSAKGDIIIQPNGYDVNFLSIKVEAGGKSQTWTVSNGTTFPSGWSVSDGSRWILEDGAYYLEGGGYILISAGVLDNYTTATVTINAYGDTGKTAKIKVNNETKAILNGVENARDYIWTINNN